MKRRKRDPRLQRLIDRMHAQHGADGLLTMVLSMEALVALRGDVEAQASAYLSMVEAVQPWMMEFAIGYASRMLAQEAAVQ